MIIKFFVYFDFKRQGKSNLNSSSYMKNKGFVLVSIYYLTITYKKYIDALSLAIQII